MNLRLAYRVRGRVYSTCANVYNYRENPQSVTHSSLSLTRKLKPEKFLLTCIHKDDYNRLLANGLSKRYISHWLSYSRHHIIIPKSEQEYQRYICSILKYANVSLGLLSYLLCVCSNPLIRAIIVPLNKIVYALRGKK